eukprot:13778334-Heterocapsa_arctica.AAC.1
MCLRSDTELTVRASEKIDEQLLNDIFGQSGVVRSRVEKVEKLEKRENILEKERMLVDDEKMEETRPVRNEQCIPSKRAPLTTSEGAMQK